MTTESDVLGQMIEAGLPEIPDRLEVSGTLRRFGRGKRGWYRLYANTARSGRSYVTGAFGYWGRVDGTRVRPAVDFDAIDRAEHERRMREIQAAEQRRRDDLARRAAMGARERWRAASRSGDSLYLRRKAIDLAEAVRFEPDGTMLVPMLRYDLPRDQALVGVQAIRPDGDKRFGRGTAKRGASCRMGCVVVGEPILVCEGYATAASVRAAVDRRLPVYIAFDAGNLQPVVELVRQLHEQCPIVICADDDWRTPGNPGRDKARRCSVAVPDTHMIYPVWPVGAAPRGTDFNDLHTSAGIGVVRRQLGAGLRLIGYRMEVARAA